MVPVVRPPEPATGATRRSVAPMVPVVGLLAEPPACATWRSVVPMGPIAEPPTTPPPAGSRPSLGAPNSSPRKRASGAAGRPAGSPPPHDAELPPTALPHTSSGADGDTAPIPAPTWLPRNSPAPGDGAVADGWSAEPVVPACWPPPHDAAALPTALPHTATGALGDAAPIPAPSWLPASTAPAGTADPAVG